jgi:hypothetical protein
MVMFSTETAADTGSVVEDVFSRPIALRNEATTEAKAYPGNVIALTANYRGFNAEARGKKARGAGSAVLDLSAVARIPASELPLLIEKLRELEENLEAGIAQAGRMQ